MLLLLLLLLLLVLPLMLLLLLQMLLFLLVVLVLLLVLMTTRGILDRRHKLHIFCTAQHGGGDFTKAVGGGGREHEGIFFQIPITLLFQLQITVLFIVHKPKRVIVIVRATTHVPIVTHPTHPYTDHSIHRQKPVIHYPPHPTSTVLRPVLILAKR